MKDIHVRVPTDVADWLQREADKNERTVPRQVIYLLKQAMANDPANKA